MALVSSVDRRIVASATRKAKSDVKCNVFKRVIKKYIMKELKIDVLLSISQPKARAVKTPEDSVAYP